MSVIVRSTLMEAPANLAHLNVLLVVILLSALNVVEIGSFRKPSMALEEGHVFVDSKSTLFQILTSASLAIIPAPPVSHLQPAPVATALSKDIKPQQPANYVNAGVAIMMISRTNSNSVKNVIIHV